MDNFRRKINGLINDSRDAQEVDKVLAEVEQRVKELEKIMFAMNRAAAVKPLSQEYVIGMTGMAIEKMLPQGGKQDG